MVRLYIQLLYCVQHIYNVVSSLPHPPRTGSTAHHHAYHLPYGLATWLVVALQTILQYGTCDRPIDKPTYVLPSAYQSAIPASTLCWFGQSQLKFFNPIPILYPY